MALEAINKIQEAEAFAKNIIDKAVMESKEILSAAEQRAVKEYDGIIEEASKKSKELKDKALNDGIENSKPVILQGDVDVNSILNTSEEKIDSAVNLVIGRIVKFNGNS